MHADHSTDLLTLRRYTSVAQRAGASALADPLSRGLPLTEWRSHLPLDLTPLVQALVALALAAISAVTPFIAPLLSRYLHIQLSAMLAAAVQSAADAGAKAAYGCIATNGVSYRADLIRNAAITVGVQHVMASAPGRSVC